VLCEDIDDQPPLSFQQLAGPQESEMLHITQRLQQIYGGKGTVQTAFDTELRQAIQDRIGASATQRRTVGARDCCVVVLDSQAQPISMNLCRERSDPEAGKVNGCLNKRQT